MKKIISVLMMVVIMVTAACASAEESTPTLGVDNNKIIVTNAVENGTLILAFYNNGVLAGTNMYHGSGTIEADISTAPEDATYVKAFYWDIHSIMPIGNVITLPLDGEQVESPTAAPTEEPTATPTEEPGKDNVMIKIGDKEFTATFYENKTAEAFKALFPLTLNMSELNGNEKYFFMADSLPTSTEKVGKINAGDIMLYGSDCIVLFYETFNTSYSYTRIGHIDDVTGLAEAVGSGSVTVTFE